MNDREKMLSEALRDLCGCIDTAARIAHAHYPTLTKRLNKAASKAEAALAEVPSEEEN